MLAETTEFQISQYLDGTLGAAEAAALELVIAADPEARKVLTDYRQLNHQLTTAHAVPSVNWDRLSDHISASISTSTKQESQQNNRPAVAGRIGFWTARIRIAAAVLVTVGAAMTARHYLHHAPVLPAPSMGGDVAVSGPSAEPPAGPASVEIAVGASATAMHGETARYGEANRPSKVVISGLTPTPKNDSH